MSETGVLFRFVDGTEVRVAADVELEALGADLGSERVRRELTDTLVAWHPIALRSVAETTIHILGMRSGRPVISLTSKVLRLDLRCGLAATHSGSLYQVLERGEGPASPIYMMALRQLLARWGLVALAPSHEQRTPWLN